MSRPPLAPVLCALLLCACSARPASGPKAVAPAGPSPTTATEGRGVPVELDGSNDRNSDRFDLAGGSYRVTWNLEDRSTIRGCPFFASLRPDASGARPVDLASADGERSAEGSNPVHAVAPGRYWIQVRSSCPSWHLRLEPA